MLNNGKGNQHIVELYKYPKSNYQSISINTLQNIKVRYQACERNSQH